MSLVAYGRVPTSIDPATRAKYESICRKYEIQEETTWPDVIRKVQSVRNQNTRRTDIIALRSILGREGALSIPSATRRVYSLPDALDIRTKAEGPYKGFILAMAFAGLRIGEAVALQKANVQTNGELFFIEVTASRQNTGRYKAPKSGQGRVFIPEWLYDILMDFDYPEILPNSLYKWMKRRGLQPHGLRHFYCTYLVRNVKQSRRQNSVYISAGSKRAYYGPFIHWGTHTIKGNPWMTRVANAEAPHALDELQKELDQIIRGLGLNG